MSNEEHLILRYFMRYKAIARNATRQGVTPIEREAEFIASLFRRWIDE